MADDSNGTNPTIGDVASEAGVSTSTVSAVINNKSGVRDSTREKVLAVVDELGYRPKGEKRRLIKRRHHRSIAFILKEAENPFFGHIAKGIRSYAREHDFALYMASSEGSHSAEVDLVALLQAQGVEGVVINPSLGGAHDLSYLFDLERAEYPFVLLENISGLQADVVSVDSVEVMDAVVRFLLDQGHTNIIHLAGPRYSAHSQDRIDGFVRGFSRSPIQFGDHQIVRTGAHLEEGFSVAKRIIAERGEEFPSAVTCFNDQIAIGAAKALTDAGFRIPEDVMVIGYDNIELLDYLPTPISSVEVETEEIGRKAAELLLRRIDASTPPEVEKVSWPANVVVRNASEELDRYRVANTGILEKGETSAH